MKLDFVQLIILQEAATEKGSVCPSDPVLNLADLIFEWSGTVQSLVRLGLVTRAPGTLSCHITQAGREFLATRITHGKGTVPELPAVKVKYGPH